MKNRIRGSFNWSLGWGNRGKLFGYQKFYYDGWNNTFSIFFFYIYWMSPPLEGDL